MSPEPKLEDKNNARGETPLPGFFLANLIKKGTETLPEALQ
jgi:hypothetical protein